MFEQISIPSWYLYITIVGSFLWGYLFEKLSYVKLNPSKISSTKIFELVANRALSFEEGSEILFRSNLKKGK